MSKKLLAVVSAAALALTAFVAVPAMAVDGAYSVAVTTSISGTGADSTTNAILVNVPTGDVLRASATTADTTALTVTVATTTSTGAVSVSSTGGVKLVTTTQLADVLSTSATGTQTLSLPAAGYSLVFHAYSTSTTGGTLTVSNGGNSTTLYVKGVSANGYKMTVSGPAFASTGVIYSFTAVVKDMFGNPTTGLLAANFVATGLGAFVASPTVTSSESSATPGTYTVSIAGANTANTGAGLLSVVLTTKIYAEVEAFGDRVSTGTISVNSADPSVTIAALTAQVAAITADYNALATRWNKKVDSKRKVFKKVALK
jgi:hypothetical protein